MASTPNGEFALSVSLMFPLLLLLVYNHAHPATISMIEIVLFKCSGNRIIGYIILKLK